MSVGVSLGHLAALYNDPLMTHDDQPIFFVCLPKNFSGSPPHQNIHVKTTSSQNLLLCQGLYETNVYSVKIPVQESSQLRETNGSWDENVKCIAKNNHLSGACFPISYYVIFSRELFFYPPKNYLLIYTRLVENLKAIILKSIIIHDLKWGNKPPSQRAVYTSLLAPVVRFVNRRYHIRDT